MITKVTVLVEAIIAIITFATTLLIGNYFLDLVVGIVTYSSARLFWRYYRWSIIKKIDTIKNKFKK